MMKIVTIIIVLLLSMQMVSAVGIKWLTEGIRLDENSEKCVTYYAYNPSDNDINVKAELTDSLAEVLVGVNNQELFIGANTPHDQAKKLDFCFKSKKVYQADCLIGNILCEQTCKDELKTYSGDVVLTESYASGASGSGSGASIAASAPLNVQVICSPYERDWNPLYIAGIVIVLIILGILFYEKYSTPQLMRDEERLKRLQNKIKKEKGKK